jgi:hypothetical protein
MKNIGIVFLLVIGMFVSVPIANAAKGGKVVCLDAGASNLGKCKKFLFTRCSPTSNIDDRNCNGTAVMSDNDKTGGSTGN